MMKQDDFMRGLLDRLGDWHVDAAHSDHRVCGDPMTEHLPECMTSVVRMNYDCICPELRACEQRVFQEQITGRQHDMVLGYQRGLAAARRAVQVLPKGGMGQKAHALWRDALAAIDALREKS